MVTKLKNVIFLDIAFNLNNGTFELYKKLNDSLLYIKKFKPLIASNKTAA